jgi:predicted RNA-binding protein with EMAP domain
MKTPRDKIVEALDRFVGEDKESTDFESRTQNWLKQDLRSQIPNIADEVLKIVVGEIKSRKDVRTDGLYFRGLDWNGHMEDIITSLTQGTTSTKKEE